MESIATMKRFSGKVQESPVIIPKIIPKVETATPRATNGLERAPKKATDTSANKIHFV